MGGRGKASSEALAQKAQQAGLGPAGAPVDAPEAGAASSVLQPRRAAPPRPGQLGDSHPPIGARSRSRGRRPRPERKEPLVASVVEVRWTKIPAAVVCRSRIRLTRRRGVAVFPGTRQRSYFSAPDASAFSTGDSRRATTFCDPFPTTSKSSAYPTVAPCYRGRPRNCAASSRPQLLSSWSKSFRQRR